MVGYKYWSYYGSWFYVKKIDKNIFNQKLNTRLLWMKVGASRLKQCSNFFLKMWALKYTIGFVKTCNLKMLYLVFGNEIRLAI